ncbi:MAG: hypothetical protein ACLQFM_00710 [Terriglobales bacterium]
MHPLLISGFKNIGPTVETRLAASSCVLINEKLIISDVEAPGQCVWIRPCESPEHSSPEPYPLLFLISTSLKVELNMKNRTDTLEIGSLAPDFSVGAANREGLFTLAGLLAQGALILEFLRGTW